MGPVRKFQSTLPHGERQRGHRQKQPSGEFQSTLPHGERRQNQQEANKIERFNPRSRTGSDSIQNRNRRHYTWFQSTLPHGERPTSEVLKGVAMAFQSTLPHGERLNIRDGQFRPFFAFQSTLPHGERLAASLSEEGISPVSIHAPARGATTLYDPFCVFFSVSIHAPARGATRKEERGMQSMGGFNPRSRTGSDRGACYEQ